MSDLKRLIGFNSMRCDLMRCDAMLCFARHVPQQKRKWLVGFRYESGDDWTVFLILSLCNQTNKLKTEMTKKNIAIFPPPKISAQAVDRNFKFIH
mmetsp:Transcript_5459/g.10271  ORF Transcript_5459/g.10271 Transcript_5459/m.10271 type:complete len:95 (+) Transcript_5459:2464-2748(+)